MMVFKVMYNHTKMEKDHLEEVLKEKVPLLLVDLVQSTIKLQIHLMMITQFEHLIEEINIHGLRRK